MLRRREGTRDRMEILKANIRYLARVQKFQTLAFLYAICILILSVYNHVNNSICVAAIMHSSIQKFGATTDTPFPY